ncbi:hypothetical protein J4471_04550 [Candidatus Woesearchaeota archaeon]|nr:hypothetical protein [Candidatus Woesearchaeota archaeon]
MKYQFLLKRFNLDINVLKNKLNPFSRGEFTSDNLTNRIQLSGWLNKEKVKNLDEIDIILEEEKQNTPLKFENLRNDLLKIALKHKKVCLRIKQLSSIKISSSVLKKKLENFLINSFIDLQEPKTTILIELFKENGKVFYRIFSYQSNNIIVEKKQFSNLSVLIENPQGKEEIANFLRLCLIFNLGLLVIHEDKEKFHTLLNNAKKETKGKLSNFNVQVYKSLSDVKGYIKIGFSKHAKLHERDLFQFIDKNKNKKILLVFGNEHFGLTQQTRDKLPFLFCLTEEKIKPLKADQALAYFLGIYNSIINL